MSYTEVIERITKNECAGAGLKDTPMLVGLWTNTDTTWVEYPGPGRSQLKPNTAVQIGALTTSFLVPQLMKTMAEEGLTLDSVAIPVRDRRGNKVRDITYRQLLLHHSDLPPYEPQADVPTLDQLLGMDDALKRQDPASVRDRYRFNHWNYVLASTALRTHASMPTEIRSRQLAFNDQLSDSLRQALLSTTTARIVTPQERTVSDIFAPSTGGVASALQLVGLLDSLAREDLSQIPLASTLSDRPNTSIAPGWHVIKLKQGTSVLINSGNTRFFGAAVAYYQHTNTGVVVVSADGKRLDCLAMDILRNLNQNWRMSPPDEQE